MKRILIVDNEVNVVGSINNVMTGSATDFEMSQHTSWSDAVFKIENSAPFDLIITDFHMPRGKEGLVVISTARAKSIKTKILLISGDICGADLEEAAPDGYLTKPFSNDDLMEMVKKLLPDLEIIPRQKPLMDIPRDKNYPVDSVQCNDCGGHGCTTCSDRGWLTPSTHPQGRMCEREGCGKPIPPAQVAVYCTDECAFADA